MNNIELELDEINKNVIRGYEIAQCNLTNIKNIIQNIDDNFIKADNEQYILKRISNSGLINVQREELNKLKTKILGIENDILSLSQRKDKFSIVIYGKTMVGKSTLMAILTHGNDDCIGKGAQRTTQNIRHYEWKGLKITDVPGVCSFGGTEDDELALEAAKAADLIIFMITNDAPQADEAKCLAQLKDLGKPVLGIVNVKYAYNEERRKFSIHKIKECLNKKSDLDDICEQFKEYANMYNQNWSDIPFVYTHLKVMYYSQKKTPIDEELYELSNFAEVEKMILEKIKLDGRFLRFKTYIDSVAVPYQEILSYLYEKSSENVIEYLKWNELEIKIEKWKTKFEEEAYDKISTYHRIAHEKMRRKIEYFVENNYENSNVSEEWKNVVKKSQISNEYVTVLKELAKEYDNQKKYFYDLLNQKTDFVLNNKPELDIKLQSTNPYLKWIINTLPNLILMLPIPQIQAINLGGRLAIGIAGPILGGFMDDKAKKIEKNKKELNTALTKSTNKMLEGLFNDTKKIFNEDILQKGVNECIRRIQGLKYIFFHLANEQIKFAYSLYKEYRNINLLLLKDALIYTGHDDIIDDNIKIARIPGNDLIAIGKTYNINCCKLSKLIGENVIYWESDYDSVECAEIIMNCELSTLQFYSDTMKEYLTAVNTNKKPNHNEMFLAQQLLNMPVILGGN